MTYFISNIEEINALENGRMIIFFKDNTQIEINNVTFDHEAGTIEVGYIF